MLFPWPVEDFEEAQACSNGRLSVGIGKRVFSHRERKGTTACHSPTGLSKSGVFFCCNYPLTLFFLYYHYCVFYEQSKQNSVVVATQVLKALEAGGQGFDPCLQQIVFS